jgi:hypothetical protein
MILSDLEIGNALISGRRFYREEMDILVSSCNQMIWNSEHI